MNRKGFAPLIVIGIIAVLAVVGTIGYFMWKNSMSSSPTQQTLMQQTSTAIQAPPSVTTTTPVIQAGLPTSTSNANIKDQYGLFNPTTLAVEYGGQMPTITYSNGGIVASGTYAGYNVIIANLPPTTADISDGLSSEKYFFATKNYSTWFALVDQSAINSPSSVLNGAIVSAAQGNFFTAADNSYNNESDVFGRKTYTDTTNGYSLEYPATWTSKGTPTAPYFTAPPDVEVFEISSVAGQATPLAAAQAAIQKNNCPGDHVIASSSPYGTLFVLNCSAGSEIYNYTFSTPQGHLVNLSYHDDFDEQFTAAVKLQTILNPIINSIVFNLPADMSSWKTYTNQQYGFSVSYPPAPYLFASTGCFGNAFCLTSTPGDLEMGGGGTCPGGNPDPNACTTEGYFFGFSTSSYSGVFDMTNYLNSQYSDTDATITTSTINGNLAYSFVFNDGPGPNPDIVIPHNGIAYEIFDSSQYIDNVPLFNQVLSTFKFTQ